LRSNILVVYYENEQATAAAKPAAGTKPAAGAAGGAPAPTSTSSQQIRLAEAKGDVIVVQKDQTATGDNGVFDMRANTVTLIGNVVISQGANVVKGDRLTVDMTTGVSRVECGKTATSCRVQALFQPNTVKQEPRPPDTAPAHDAPRQRAPKPSGLY